MFFLPFASNTNKYYRTSLCLCDVFMPTPRQSFFIPNEVMRQVRPPAQSETATYNDGGNTPLPTDFERETIFTGVWSPGHRTSIPSNSGGSSSSVTWTPASPPPHMQGFLSPDPSLFSPPSPPRPDASQSSVFDGHWILHPKLVGTPIQVDINGGELDTSTKKTGIFVETVVGTHGNISVIYRRSAKQIIDVPFNTVIPSRQRPKPSTEKGLMVVARSHPNHIGKLVRQVHHFYEKEKIEENHLFVLVTVERSGGQETQGSEFLELHGDDLDHVKETPDERKHSKELLELLRMEFAALGVCVRDKMDFFTVS